MTSVTMDYVIFGLIVLIIKCDAGNLSTTENAHALLNTLSLSEYVDVPYYTAVTNKPLDLPFHDVSVFSGGCYDFYNRAGKLEASISNSMIHVNNVTHSMSTLWLCTVLEHKVDYRNYMILKKKIFTLYLNLHVKSAKSVEITVNGSKLTFSEADLSVPYDGDTIYFYVDGEHVLIVCRNLYSVGSVHLESSSKDSANISNSSTLFIHLHSERNSSYIDCVYNSIEPADSYVYRVTFVIKEQLFYSNDSKLLSNVLANISAKGSSLVLGSSIGAVLVILGLTGVACWCVRTRHAKQIKTLYGDFTKENDSSTPTYTNGCENQYDACHSEYLSNKETDYEKPGSVENNTDPEDHYYEKID